MQRPGLPRGVAFIRGADNERQGAHHSVPGIGLRRRWLRAFGRQYVSHTPRLIRESMGTGRIMVANWQQRRGLRRADVAGIFVSLVPVTISNIIGGGALVGGVYWFIYLRTR